jgi:hypothetical protein
MAKFPRLSTLFFHSFIHQWLYSPLLDPGLFFSFIIFFTQTTGLLGQVISPWKGRYLHTGQQKHRINAHTDFHAWSGIRIHVPSIRVSLTPRDHCNRLSTLQLVYNPTLPQLQLFCVVEFEDDMLERIWVEAVVAYPNIHMKELRKMTAKLS